MDVTTLRAELERLNRTMRSTSASGAVGYDVSAAIARIEHQQTAIADKLDRLQIQITALTQPVINRPHNGADAPPQE